MVPGPCDPLAIAIADGCPVWVDAACSVFQASGYGSGVMPAHAGAAMWVVALGGCKVVPAPVVLVGSGTTTGFRPCAAA